MGHHRLFSLVPLPSLAWLGLQLLLMSSTAYTFSFNVVNFGCSSITWSASLSASDWSSASLIDFYVQNIQAPAISLTDNYTVTNNGDFPSPGSYTKNTPFSRSAPNGQYIIGAILLAVDGSTIASTPSTSPIYTLNGCPADGVNNSTGASSTSVGPTSFIIRPTSSLSTPASHTTVHSSTSSGASIGHGQQTLSGSHSHVGAIVAAVVGVVGVLIVGGLIYFCCYRKKRRHSDANQRSFTKQIDDDIDKQAEICQTTAVVVSENPFYTGDSPDSSVTNSPSFEDIKIVHVPVTLASLQSRSPPDISSKSIPRQQSNETLAHVANPFGDAVRSPSIDQQPYSPKQTFSPNLSEKKPDTFRVPRVNVPVYTENDIEQWSHPRLSTSSNNVSKSRSANETFSDASESFDVEFVKPTSHDQGDAKPLA